MGKVTRKPPMQTGGELTLTGIPGFALDSDTRELMGTVTPEAAEAVRRLAGKESTRYRDSLYADDIGEAAAMCILDKAVTTCLSIPGKESVDEGDNRLVSAMMKHPFIEYRETAISTAGVILRRNNYNHPLFDEVADRVYDPQEDIRIQALRIGFDALDHRTLPEKLLGSILDAMDSKERLTRMWAARVTAKAVGKQDLPAEAHLKLFKIDTGNPIVQREIQEALQRDMLALTKPGLENPEPVIGFLVETALGSDQTKAEKAREALREANKNYPQQTTQVISAKISEAGTKAAMLQNLQQEIKEKK